MVRKSPESAPQAIFIATGQMARAELSDMKLDFNTLEKLKNISPGAYACAVYSAAINNDLVSLHGIARHLLGVTNGQSSAKLMDGKSILDKEYEVNAFTVNESGKVVNDKNKSFIYEMLFTPLANCTADDFRKSEVLQAYAKDLASMIKLLKIKQSSVLKAIYIMAQQKSEYPFREIVRPMIEAMNLSEPNYLIKATWVLPMGFGGSANKFGGYGPIASIAPKEVIRGHQNFLLEMALRNDSFCKGLVKIGENEKNFHEYLQPQYSVFSGLPGTAWPKDAQTQKALRDTILTQSIHKISRGFQRTSMDTDYMVEPFFSDLLDPHSGKRIGAAEVIRQYSQFEQPLRDAIGEQLSIFGNGYCQYTPEIWSVLEPLQERVTASGGRALWSGLFKSAKNFKTEVLMGVIEKYAAKDAKGAAQALQNLALHIYYLQGTEESSWPQMATALIAAGADPLAGESNSFKNLCTKFIPDSKLAKSTEVLSAIAAYAAKADLVKNDEANTVITQTRKHAVKTP